RGDPRARTRRRHRPPLRIRRSRCPGGVPHAPDRERAAARAARAGRSCGGAALRLDREREPGGAPRARARGGQAGSVGGGGGRSRSGSLVQRVLLPVLLLLWPAVGRAQPRPVHAIPARPPATARAQPSPPATPPPSASPAAPPKVSDPMLAPVPPPARLVGS